MPKTAYNDCPQLAIKGEEVCAIYIEGKATSNEGEDSAQFVKYERAKLRKYDGNGEGIRNAESAAQFIMIFTYALQKRANLNVLIVHEPFCLSHVQYA